ncbi:hypothetical protein DFH08DRAFT_1081236 [Mycena albidolilacea]|uniref:DUF6533 domain-containing protein n=1 Tax=Mycena albidolilacea TaxID=1033008 RepID=A0AAD6ZXY5_9AGAR|nr:hypothetical protein DFH08DRAFT_1081236 [Mycena albidolilacea]
MATIQFDVIALAQDQRLRRSIYLAGVTVLCYDHLLSLGSEVAHIWTPRARRTSAWFLLVRYVALLSNLVLAAYFLGDLSAEVDIYTSFLSSPANDIQSCKKLSSAEDYLLVIQETFVEVTLALRVCAMYGFNRRVFAALGVAAVITISLGATWLLHGKLSLYVISSYSASLSTAPTRTISWQGPVRVPFSAQWFVTGQRISRLVNLANILMLYTGDIITAGSLAWFASTISVTMVTRLMLNLHDAANGSNWTSPTLNLTASEVGHIAFRRQEDVSQRTTIGAVSDLEGHV